MDKIYRRESLPTASGIKKKKNEKNRKRNEIINFHVSHEERELIETRVKLSGLTRRQYFLDSTLTQNITAIGNIKTFTAIKNELEELSKLISVDPQIKDLEPKKLMALKTICEILHSLFKEHEIRKEKEL